MFCTPAYVLHWRIVVVILEQWVVSFDGFNLPLNVSVLYVMYVATILMVK